MGESSFSKGLSSSNLFQRIFCDFPPQIPSHEEDCEAKIQERLEEGVLFVGEMWAKSEWSRNIRTCVSFRDWCFPSEANCDEDHFADWDMRSCWWREVYCQQHMYLLSFAPSHSFPLLSFFQDFIFILQCSSLRLITKEYMDQIILQPKRQDWWRLPRSNLSLSPWSDFVFLQELLGISAYFRTKTPGLHLPLVTLVNFLGHRLMAAALLPVTESGTEWAHRSLHTELEAKGIFYVSMQRRLCTAVRMAGVTYGIKIPILSRWFVTLRNAWTFANILCTPLTQRHR